MTDQAIQQAKRHRHEDPERRVLFLNGTRKVYDVDWKWSGCAGWDDINDGSRMRARTYKGWEIGLVYWGKTNGN